VRRTILSAYCRAATSFRASVRHLRLPKLSQASASVVTCSLGIVEIRRSRLSVLLSAFDIVTPRFQFILSMRLRFAALSSALAPGAPVQARGSYPGALVCAHLPNQLCPHPLGHMVQYPGALEIREICLRVTLLDWREANAKPPCNGRASVAV